MLEQMARPDSDLPAELRHEDIVEVEHMSSSERFRFEIVFGRREVPYGYANTLREEGWEITHSRVTYDRGGLLTSLGLPLGRSAVAVTVEMDAPDFSGGGAA